MRTLACIVLLLVSLTQNGCITAEAIDTARGHARKDEYGQTFHSSPPEPAIYLLVPLAASADALTLPLFAAGVILMCLNGPHC